MYLLVIREYLFYVSKDATYMPDLVYYGSLFRLQIETIPRKRANETFSRRNERAGRVHLNDSIEPRKSCLRHRSRSLAT